MRFWGELSATDILDSTVWAKLGARPDFCDGVVLEVRAVIEGGSGDDLLRGGVPDDDISGGDATDTLNGGAAMTS